MTSGPVVSAVAILLNEEEFIREAVESVFAQSYRHCELVPVDHGLMDGSAAIARGYAERHPVRYVEREGHRNRGTSMSRNLGARSSRRKYIAFLDGDLWLYREARATGAGVGRRPVLGGATMPLCGRR
jgi:glycosyltransferase involved in cell wall biosynthesis